MSSSTVAELDERVDAICRKLCVPTDPYLLQMTAAAYRLGIRSARLVRVSPDYYSLPLAQRAAQIGQGCTVNQLCKSLVVANSLHPTESVDDPRFSKYYFVILPYNRRILSHELFKTVRFLSPELPKRYFKVDSARMDKAIELTGYRYNGMTPLNSKTKLPIILDRSVAELSPPYFWIGGGTHDVKFGLSVHDLITQFAPVFIGDFTEPRGADEVGVDGTELSE